MPPTLVPRRKTISPIGLDLGRSAARAVQLRRRDQTWSLVAATTWHCSGGKDSAAELRSLPQRIRPALRNQSFEGRAVVAGLSQPDVELHPLELPRPGQETHDGQIDSAARWEIERLSRFQDQAKQTAHWWLPPGRAMRTTAMGVAVPEPAVREVWDTCCRAGAECRGVDVLPCALARAAAVLRPPGGDEVWGVLDLGARTARLVICIDQVPVLARSLEAGGQGWTEKIAASLQIGVEGAELHKCDHGIHPVRVRGPGASGLRPIDDQDATLSELASMIFAALRPDLERIAGEIERSYEYVLQCYPPRKAADLILAGGGAALKRLDTYLADRLGIPVRRADVYLDRGKSLLHVDHLTGKLREPISAYLGAIGLAISPGSKA